MTVESTNTALYTGCQNSLLRKYLAALLHGRGKGRLLYGFSKAR
jgi:hypothetical protein